MSNPHPRALLLLCLVEALERLAASLLAALLLFYLTEQLHHPEAQALDLQGTFNGLAYLAPLGGGLLADRVLGYWRTIALGTAALALGYLALATEPEMWLLPAGALLILGHGLFKSTISASIGRLYAERDQRHEAAYRWFYFAVNVGGTIGPVIGSALYRVSGWRSALSFATAALVIAALLLVIGRTTLAGIERASSSMASPGASTGVVFWRRLQYLSIVLVGLIAYGLAHYQVVGTLLLYARDDIDRTVTAYTLPPSLFAALPSALTLLAAPLMTYWRTRQRKGRAACGTRGQLGIGAVFNTAGFVVLLIADIWRGDAMVSSGILLAVLALLTLGEVLILPASLELVSRLAPPRWPALSMALWFLALAVGQWGAGRLGGWWMAWPHHQFFMVMVLFSLGAGLAFATLDPQTAHVAQDQARKP